MLLILLILLMLLIMLMFDAVDADTKEGVARDETLTF